VPIIIHLFLHKSLLFSYLFFASYAVLFLQAALGESKKASGIAIMYVKVDDQKLAIGTLSTDKCPQIQFDLVF
jgi:hypothetical protein